MTTFYTYLQLTPAWPRCRGPHQGCIGSSAAAEGDVALTERRYREAAQLFGQAADYIPSGHAGERGGYLLRQADSFYRQGDERGDNDALRSSIGVYRRALVARVIQNEG